MAKCFNKKKYKSLQFETLIELCKEQDYNALNELILRKEKSIFATLSYLNNNEINTLDLTQEVLMKMVKNIQTLNKTKCFNSWLNQIIMNTFYDSLRKNRQPISYISDSDFHEKEKHLSDEKNSPLEKNINAELNMLIEKSIKKLPQNYRTTLILREFQNLSYEEIAKLTNVNIGTVKSRISRARLKLQQDLKKYIA